MPALVQKALIKKNNWKTIVVIRSVNPIPDNPPSFKYDSISPKPKLL